MALLINDHSPPLLEYCLRQPASRQRVASPPRLSSPSNFISSSLVTSYVSFLISTWLCEKNQLPLIYIQSSPSEDKPRTLLDHTFKLLQNAVDATMDTPDSEYLLTRLRGLANNLRQPGTTKWDFKWDSLKDYLIRTPKFKFNEGYLDDNRTQITEQCLQCLADSLTAVTTFAPAIQQTATAVAQGTDMSSLLSENQPNRLVPNKKAQVDDGFIRIPNKLDPCGARFSYSNKDYSRISRDFVDREGLLPLVGENKTIILVFWLHDLRPKKSYKIEFKVQKQAQFDVSLGKNWNQEKCNLEEESASQNLSTLTIRRTSPGGFTFPNPPHSHS